MKKCPCLISRVQLREEWCVRIYALYVKTLEKFGRQQDMVGRRLALHSTLNKSLALFQETLGFVITKSQRIVCVILLDTDTSPRVIERECHGRPVTTAFLSTLKNPFE